MPEIRHADARAVEMTPRPFKGGLSLFPALVIPRQIFARIDFVAPELDQNFGSPCPAL